ncbi:cupin [Geothrix limicola]|uniref:Cupin n=1 Tax=Geothrix limicola TaxID=2927978 RepID=A0ABQ5QKX2_9BACT|nr:cupin domain-containing protein [Geothrix limicola]GLH74863.1 cupin [Geothrix limicola]
MTFTNRLSLAATLLLPGAFTLLHAQAPAVASTTLLRTGTAWTGAPLVYPRLEHPEIQTVLVEIAPGAATAWHKHPMDNIAYILEGSLRLELEDGTTRTFQKGEAFAEVVNTWHRGVNVGTAPLKILVVYTGEKGTPLSILKDASKPGEH